MAVPGSYNASTYHRDLESELNRLRAQLALSWNKEARNLQWLGLCDGMSVIELGSGPGFSTENLLQLFPHNVITSVEIDPLMAQQARQQLQTYSSAGRFQLLEANANDTGLPDNSQDFAIARLLFQHLPEPLTVLQEVWRVLKPGGKLVITDVDGDLFWLFEPPLSEAALISERMSQAQAAQGGDRQISHKLWRLLQAAGFQNLDLELIAAHSDELGLPAFLPQLDPDLLLNLVKVGLLSEPELAQIAQSREAFVTAPDPFVLLMWFMVSGVKVI
ncbi:MAG: class I SAM-dependent methyltransferase [Spirulinaceae cyanobacterium]